MRLSVKTLALAAVGLALIGGGGAAIAASHGGGTPSPSVSAFLDDLAKRLGVSTDKLKDAAKAAAIDQVDAALQAGTITKDQADALKAKIQSAEGLPLFGFGFGGFHHGPFGFGDYFSAAADYLGLTVAQLQDKLASGQSLADMAKAQGKSVDGLKQAIYDTAKKQLDKAVSDKTLTADQEKTILDRLQSRLDDIVNGTFHKRGWGGRFFGPRPSGGAFFGPPPVWTARA